MRVSELKVNGVWAAWVWLGLLGCGTVPDSGTGGIAATPDVMSQSVQSPGSERSGSIAAISEEEKTGQTASEQAHDGAQNIGGRTCMDIQWIGEPWENGDIVLSSLTHVVLKDGHFVVAAHDALGQVLIWPDPGKSPMVVSPHGQLACMEAYEDGYRVATIARDASNSGYALEVRTYDRENRELDGEMWKAATRGFEPDASSRCVFLSRREILATGTRPRGDSAPYHGLFKIASRALTFYDETRGQTASIVSGGLGPEGPELVLRQVCRRESNSPKWCHRAVRVNSSLDDVVNGDFVVKSEDAYVVIGADGCLERPQGTACPDRPLALESVEPLQSVCGDAQASCFLYREKTASWLARIPHDGGKPQVWAFAPGLVVFDLTDPSSERGNRVRSLAAEIDETRPGVARKLGWIEIDLSCLEIHP